ncbi:MAG: type 2 isopentenyl-diphosphate Delta-isomerase [Anaerolineae bacterium]|jgi:isopentenyl-diphosphate delta-isomerase
MHQARKSEHLRINLEEDVEFNRVSTGLERYRLIHSALPDLDLQSVDTSTQMLGKRLAAPVIISAMTGGTPYAETINRRLAEAAQGAGIGMGLGSQRAAIEEPALTSTYQVRHVAPSILLFANLGAVQLNYGYGADECRRAVEMIEADALVLHLNPLQEALQPEGNTRFAGLLTRIGDVCRALDVPVVVKEVGFGISADVARQLASAGVAAIDVSGAGGTSWSQVEMHRASADRGRAVASAFEDWGIPTAESLRMARLGAPEVSLLASGGIRHGIDVAKAIALGADACGVARPFLQAAAESASSAADLAGILINQLRAAMFATGSRDIAALQEAPVLYEAREGRWVAADRLTAPR